MLRTYLVPVAFVGACFGDGGKNPDAGGDHPDATTPHPPATHFETEAENRPVPSSGLPDGFNWYVSYAGVRFWQTIDLDGDGFEDIVQTGDTAVTEHVWDAGGAPHWKVFAGGAAGWSTGAIDWPVPPNGRPEGFFSANTTGYNREWVTIYLDGDDRPDLVHTMDPATGKVWDATGARHWKVYLGKASGGFDPTGIAWPVPDSGTDAGFAQANIQWAPYCWQTRDITGDGRPDLIQTMDPATAKVWDVASAPHWKVFENTGTGFALQPMLWSVPSSGTEWGFRVTEQEWAYEHWLTRDLDGDGKLDLVQTADPATGTVWDAAGEPYWKVFAGGASGFAAMPTSWRVPASGLAEGFFQAYAFQDYRRWTLIDLDGDDKLDLVQTGDTSHAARVWDAAGSPYWKMFTNTGSGFSLELYRWPVPRGTADGFSDVERASANLHWIVIDTDHDGYRDLVQTMDPATSMVWDATGAAYWKVYRGRP